MKCPSCGSTVTIRRSGALDKSSDTGAMTRVVLVHCPRCGNGKCAVTYDFEFFQPMAPGPDFETKAAA